MKNGEKKSISSIIALLIMLAITAVTFVFSDKLYGTTSFFVTLTYADGTVVDNNVLKALFKLVPPIVKSVQIIAVAWLISVCVRWFLHTLLAKSSRSRTIVKMINNFLKYLIAIIAVFLVLGAWGVDTATLLASAGILSLIVGLGAQSLISDIIAGMFIVFEDEFRVGDIVIIDGWRGTVDEIGIRATKVIDWQGNIKIVNNSQISTIINQSKELSVTTCVVGIGYGESIPKVELVIKDNLERIKQAIPEIVEGPYYKGVDSLAASSVNLLFVATVKESDYYVAQRALNREIKMVFDENGINIPFPQVTVSYAEAGDNSSDNADKSQAAAFNVEQRTVSKNMEDSNV